MSDGRAIFSHKAEAYARYRWSYAPAAIRVFCETAQLGSHSWVADLGAGTGILTRQLARWVGRLSAVEPNPEMRRAATKALAAFPTCEVLDASAEDTNLPGQSVDAITAAQAIHWFNPLPARREFQRILKPGGWLGCFRNSSTRPELEQALEGLNIPENGVARTPHGSPFGSQPPGFYFGGETYQKQSFPFTFQQNWEGFFGALISTSFMPDEGHPCFSHLEAAARAVFDRFSAAGWLEVRGETELILGQPQY